MDLKNKNIFITGGAGFIGSHIIDQLLANKVKKITILDNFQRGVPENLAHVIHSKKIKFINGDIRDVSLVNKLSKGIDCIIHQAAVSLLRCLEEPRLCHEVIVDGAFNVLEAAVANKVKKLVMASSVSVYGEASYVPIDEKHPYNNIIVYGAAKIANEHMAIAFHHAYKIPIILLRYFNTYGPRMDTAGAYTEVIIKWIKKIEAGESPIIHGDGKQSLDFVYVKDTALATILALKSNVNFGIYNVGTGKTTTLKELVEYLIAFMDSDVKPIFENNAPRPFVQKRQASTVKAEKELGFKTSVSLKEGLKELIKWRKETLRHKRDKSNTVIYD